METQKKSTLWKAQKPLWLGRAQGLESTLDFIQTVMGSTGQF